MPWLLNMCTGQLDRRAACHSIEVCARHVGPRETLWALAPSRATVCYAYLLEIGVRDSLTLPCPCSWNDLCLPGPCHGGSAGAELAVEGG